MQKLKMYQERISEAYSFRSIVSKTTIYDDTYKTLASHEAIIKNTYSCPNCVSASFSGFSCLPVEDLE